MTRDLDALTTNFGSIEKAFSYYGYYPALIAEFNSTEYEVLLKNMGINVDGLINIKTRESLVDWEYIHNVNIYRNFQDITSRLLTPMLNLHNSNDLFGGSKKIKMISKSKISKKQRRLKPPMKNQKTIRSKPTRKQKNSKRKQVKLNKISKRKHRKHRKTIKKQLK